MDVFRPDILGNLEYSDSLKVKKGQFRCARRSPIALVGAVDVLKLVRVGFFLTQERIFVVPIASVLLHTKYLRDPPRR